MNNKRFKKIFEQIDWENTKRRAMPFYWINEAFYKKLRRKEREANRKHKRWTWLGHHKPVK